MNTPNSTPSNFIKEQIIHEHLLQLVWPDDTLLQPFWLVNTYLARDGQTTPKSGTLRQAWLVDDTLIQLVWPDYTLLQQVWLDNNLLQQVWPD